MSYVSSFLAAGTFRPLVRGVLDPRGQNRHLFEREARVGTTVDMLDEVEEDLMARSFLFANPISYRDGVGAATQAIRVMLAKVDPTIGAERTREETS
jgi:hypothetical protein